MINDISTATLEECLQDFRERFNDNARVKKLIVGWNRAVLVGPRDASAAYTMTIENLEMTRVSPGITESDGTVLLQADEVVLKRIFTGECNPASVVRDGGMTVTSDDRDKVKLEALAMVIWGL